MIEKGFLYSTIKKSFFLLSLIVCLIFISSGGGHAVELDPGSRFSLGLTPLLEGPHGFIDGLEVGWKEMPYSLTTYGGDTELPFPSEVVFSFRGAEMIEVGRSTVPELVDARIITLAGGVFTIESAEGRLVLDMGEVNPLHHSFSFTRPDGEATYVMRWAEMSALSATGVFAELLKDSTRRVSMSAQFFQNLQGAEFIQPGVLNEGQAQFDMPERGFFIRFEQPIPEPSTVLLLSLALIPSGLLRRK